ncbi:unnamed protein product, partial [Effrenium voratum]
PRNHGATPASDERGRDSQPGGDRAARTAASQQRGGSGRLPGTHGLEGALQLLARGCLGGGRVETDPSSAGACGGMCGILGSQCHDQLGPGE